LLILAWAFGLSLGLFAGYALGVAHMNKVMQVPRCYYKEWVEGMRKRDEKG
jgi:hypothetical protein